MFSCLRGKISVNLGKSLQAFSPSFNFNTLGSLPLLFLNPVFVGALQPDNNMCGQRGHVQSSLQVTLESSVIDLSLSLENCDGLNATLGGPA